MKKFMLVVKYLSGAESRLILTERELMQDISERIALNETEESVMNWVIVPLY